jgi:putative ABC transport system permease protein
MTRAAIGTAVGLALQALRTQKLRAALTVLGVVIGTGTIIGVGSILAGFDGVVSGIMHSFGTNTLFVFKFNVGFRVGRLSPEERNRKPLTLDNLRAVSERCPSVRHVSPYLMAPWNMIHRAKYKANDHTGIDLFGTDEEYASASGAEFSEGRFFTEMESIRRLPVIVLGEDSHRTLFGQESALDKWVEVDGHRLRVIGVLKKPATSFPGEPDKRYLAPYGTMRKLFPNAQEHLLVVHAKPGLMAQAVDEVRSVLRIERRVPYNKPDNFAISTPDQVVEDFRKITSTTALVMIALSSIGLLVGGIGVMNIMLVSVTERTREIGIRKAVGARSSDIVAQFLTEAVVLTFMGGLAGMLLGWGISIAARLAFPELPTAVPLWAVALGSLVSVGVGLFFGIWPASKAARLDPVEALRYE